MSNNPTPTPNADIHAAGQAKIQVPQIPSCSDIIEAWQKQLGCWNCHGSGYAIYYPGGRQPCHVCNAAFEKVVATPAPDPRDEQLAALQSEIAQLRADLATATANAAKAQDTINGQARELDAAKRLLEEAIPYVEESEQFNKPACRTLSKRIRAVAEAALSPAKQGGGKDE